MISPKHCLLLITAVAATSSAEALTLSVNNNNGVRFLTSTGSPVPTGALVRVGYFNDADVGSAVLTGKDFAAIDALFKPFGEGVVTNGGDTTTLRIGNGGTADGYIVGAIANVSPSGQPWAGKPIYVMVYNTGTKESATEMALFSGTTTTWTMATSNLGAKAPLMADASVFKQGEAVLSAGNVVAIQLAAVPEPASLAFLALAGVGFMRRRRVS